MVETSVVLELVVDIEKIVAEVRVDFEERFAKSTVKTFDAAASPTMPTATLVSSSASERLLLGLLTHSRSGGLCRACN